jgi:hypothetical protein
MNTLHAYRSVFLSRIVAAFAAALLAAGALVLPDALMVLDSAAVGSTSHVPANDRDRSYTSNRSPDRATRA